MNCYVGDIQAQALPENIAQHHSFDAVFSNATLHWCKTDPIGVVRNAKMYLKPAGRFVAEMGGFGNTIGK